MKLARISILFLVFAVSGCSTFLYSPPARVSPLESPALLAKGDSSAELQASVHGAVFGPGLSKLGIQYSEGVSDELEIGGEANLMILSDASQPEDNVAQDHHPNIYSARLSAKWSPEALQDYVAVTAGIGGGASAAGGFLSPDLGLVVGWKNPYLTPFVSAALYASQPVNPVELDMRKNGEESPVLRKPQFTYGYSGTAGAILHLNEIDLTPGISIDFLDNSSERSAFVGLHFGIRANFN